MKITRPALPLTSSRARHGAERALENFAIGRGWALRAAMALRVPVTQPPPYRLSRLPLNRQA